MMEPIRDVTVVAPTTAVFTCKLSPGDPRADITWYKGGREVPANDRTSMTFEGDTATLTIKDTTPKDTSDIKMTATNKLGEFATEATLTVHGKSKNRDLLN